MIYQWIWDALFSDKAIRIYMCFEAENNTENNTTVSAIQYTGLPHRE